MNLYHMVTIIFCLFNLLFLLAAIGRIKYLRERLFKQYAELIAIRNALKEVSETMDNLIVTLEKKSNEKPNKATIPAEYMRGIFRYHATN